MTHPRQTIRDNVVTAVTGLTLTGSNVFASRVYPVESGALPALLIYTNNESSEYITINPPRTVQRILRLNIEIYVASNTGYDGTLDDICEDIEDALYTDLTRGGIAKDTQTISFNSVTATGGEHPVIIGTLVIEILYMTTEA